MRVGCGHDPQGEGRRITNPTLWTGRCCHAAKSVRHSCFPVAIRSLVTFFAVDRRNPTIVEITTLIGDFLPIRRHPQLLIDQVTQRKEEMIKALRNDNALLLHILENRCPTSYQTQRPARVSGSFFGS